MLCFYIIDTYFLSYFTTPAVETKHFLDVELTVVACGGGGVLVSSKREFFRIIRHSKIAWKERHHEASRTKS